MSLKAHAVFFILIGEPCHPEAVLTTLLLICCPVHVTVVCEWYSRAVGAKAQLGVRVSEKRCWRWRHCRWQCALGECIVHCVTRYALFAWHVSAQKPFPSVPLCCEACGCVEPRGPWAAAQHRLVAVMYMATYSIDFASLARWLRCPFSTAV